MNDAGFCSTRSLEVGEQLFGSTKQVSAYFLLEFDGRWEAEAFQDSAVHPPVKHWLQAALDLIPRTKVQLIRQQPRLAPAGIAFYAALVRETNPVLYAFHLASESDLLAVDLAALAAEDPAYDDHIRAEPLFLTCTHGRRDKCCARQGIPVYEQLAQHAGADVWQSSHLGGHRFAANVMALPHAITYGRVRPDSAAALVDATRAGQMVPAFYRGRACYPKVAQAAEYYLRQETGVTGLEAFHFTGTERLSGDEWKVRFVAADGGAEHCVRMIEESIQVIANCGDQVPETYSQYRRISS
jgi:hypothetical protein